MSIAVASSLVFLAGTFELLQSAMDAYSADASPSVEESVKETASDVKDHVARLKADTDDNRVTLSDRTASQISEFSVDGKVYSIPTDFKNLLDNGWQYNESLPIDTEAEIPPGETVDLSMQKQLDDSLKIFIDIDIFNNTETAVAHEGAIVQSIYAFDNNFDFVKGLTIGSTKKEITEALGDPNGVSRHEDIYQYSYSPENSRTTIYFLVDGNSAASKVMAVRLVEDSLNFE